MPSKRVKEKNPVAIEAVSKGKATPPWLERLMEQREADAAEVEDQTDDLEALPEEDATDDGVVLTVDEFSKRKLVLSEASETVVVSNDAVKLQLHGLQMDDTIQLPETLLDDGEQLSLQLDGVSVLELLQQGADLVGGTEPVEPAEPDEGEGTTDEGDPAEGEEPVEVVEPVAEENDTAVVEVTEVIEGDVTDPVEGGDETTETPDVSEPADPTDEEEPLPEDDALTDWLAFFSQSDKNRIDLSIENDDGEYELNLKISSEDGFVKIHDMQIDAEVLAALGISVEDEFDAQVSLKDMGLAVEAPDDESSEDDSDDADTDVNEVPEAEESDNEAPEATDVSDAEQETVETEGEVELPDVEDVPEPVSEEVATIQLIGYLAEEGVLQFGDML